MAMKYKLWKEYMYSSSYFLNNINYVYTYIKLILRKYALSVLKPRESIISIHVFLGDDIVEKI